MACSVSMAAAMPLTHKAALPSTTTFSFNPLTTINKKTTSTSTGRASKGGLVVVKSSLKENAAAAAAVVASMVVPEVAQAASGVSPSLNNFLLSIGAGGVVLGAILGAIIGVSNFDPVKRG